MSRSVYLVVSIDTECDKGSRWQIRHPLTFEAVNEGIPYRLTPLFNTYGVIPTYLLSPEVIQDKESVTTLTSLENCELGAHLHGEFIPPEEDFETRRTDTPQLRYAEEVEFQKLANLTQLFEERFGYYPKSFRAGRFGLSRHTLRFLVELGYFVDSSVTPFWSHSFDGAANRNYWGAPTAPYYPSKDDPGRAGDLSLLEVPVTIHNSLLVRWPRWILRRMSNRTRWHKRLFARLGKQIPRTTWLRPQRSTPEELIATADAVIAGVPSNKPVILNMMYHNVEIVPGASPYAQTDKEVQYILESQALLFEHLYRAYNTRSVGLSEVYDLTRK